VYDLILFYQPGAKAACKTVFIESASPSAEYSPAAAGLGAPPPLRLPQRLPPSQYLYLCTSKASKIEYLAADKALVFATLDTPLHPRDKSSLITVITQF